MVGIPLMFMCLTYTGDLLAGVFISSYSKIVNFTHHKLFRGQLKICLPADKRQGFEQTDVRKFFASFF